MAHTSEDPSSAPSIQGQPAASPDERTPFAHERAQRVRRDERAGGLAGRAAACARAAGGAGGAARAAVRAGRGAGAACLRRRRRCRAPGFVAAPQGEPHQHHHRHQPPRGGAPAGGDPRCASGTTVAATLRGQRAVRALGQRRAVPRPPWRAACAAAPGPGAELRVVGARHHARRASAQPARRAAAPEAGRARHRARHGGAGARRLRAERRPGAHAAVPRRQRRRPPGRRGDQRAHRRQAPLRAGGVRRRPDRGLGAGSVGADRRPVEDLAVHAGAGAGAKGRTRSAV